LLTVPAQNPKGGALRRLLGLSAKRIIRALLYELKRLPVWRSQHLKMLKTLVEVTSIEFAVIVHDRGFDTDRP
jgi:hypothetical protein